MIQRIYQCLAFAGLVFLLSVRLHAVQFQSSADVQAGGGYSEMQGTSGSWAGAGQVLYIPMVKFGSSDYFIPAVYVTDSGRQQVQNEGNTLPAFFVQSLVLTGEPEWKHEFGGTGWELGAYGTAIHGYDKDYDSEAWGKGFYDYEQYGGGLEVTRRNLAPWLNAFTLDLSESHRSLSNYHNQAIVSIGQSRDYYVDDLYIDKADLSLILPDGFLVSYSLSLERYTDSFQYLADGTFNNNLRYDKYHDLKLFWAKSLGSHWSFSAALEGTYTESNYDNYDFTSGQFLYDYFSNRMVTLGPTLAWYPSGNPKGSTVSLSCNEGYTDYLHRPQINPDGSLTRGTETDFDSTFTLFGRKTITGPWSLYGSADLDMVQSNQSSLQGVNFSYQIFDSQLGIEYQY